MVYVHASAFPSIVDGSVSPVHARRHATSDVSAAAVMYGDYYGSFSIPNVGKQSKSSARRNYCSGKCVPGEAAALGWQSIRDRSCPPLSETTSMSAECIRAAFPFPPRLDDPRYKAFPRPTTVGSAIGS